MTFRKSLLILVLALVSAIPVLPAQQPPSPPPVPAPPQTESSSQAAASFYRLDLAIREMDGEKLIDTRRYSMWLRAGNRNREQMTAGAEVPYDDKGSTHYRSVGVSFSCIIDETKDGGSPWLDLDLTISNTAPAASVPTNSGSPVFRSIRLSSAVLLVLGKSVTAGTVDDPVTKHRFDVEITATKLK